MVISKISEPSTGGKNWNCVARMCWTKHCYEGSFGISPPKKIRGGKRMLQHPMGFPHIFSHVKLRGKCLPPAAILPVKRPTSWRQSKRAPGVHWEPKDVTLQFASFVLNPWKICVPSKIFILINKNVKYFNNHQKSKKIRILGGVNK